MLRNRRIEVRLTKDDNRTEHSSSTTSEKRDITDTVADVTDTVVSGTITILGSYMLVDTIRKIVIHNFTR